MKNTYQLPAEWAKQDAVMLTWPHQATDWDWILTDVEPVFVDITLAITQYQPVLIVCHDDPVKQHVKQLLQKANASQDKIIYVIAPTNDTWARDHGPITVKNNKKQTLAYDFNFNGWGNKFESTLDNQINTHVFNQCDVAQTENVNMVLEGGAIEIDEQGHLLTTKACLLNKNRNPTLSQENIENILTEKLGAKKILWVNAGALEGDDTDSHIDTLARFAPEQIIVFQGCQDETDPHFAEIDAMKRSLESFTTLKNEPFILFELPWPDAQFSAEGDRLPATYANFLIINGAVLMPTYGVPQDRKAQIVLHMAFPEYEIIPINCRQIIEQYGSLHCLTMQLPLGFLPKT
ncbi:agmatine deiminase family protein [Algibacillus agarilyticus]|uniref:agmatine deiminase family protein n=1 Tax=Algibacillus agarilyticus TaxID=2234133 RepID=UPI000DD0D6A1|nr:agmatine deiminase family protein [Algibacillus agarilyticus]